MTTQLEPPPNAQSFLPSQKTSPASQAHEVSPLHEYLYKFHTIPRTHIRDLFHDTSNKTVDRAFNKNLKYNVPKANFQSLRNYGLQANWSSFINSLAAIMGLCQYTEGVVVFTHHGLMPQLEKISN
ncbi:hypothetical protein Trydic_g5215 [Trypoxylus dichotomus]